MANSSPCQAPSLDMTVKAILDRWPEAGPVLARRGLDLCCGGAHSLRLAAAAHGCRADAVLAEVLEAVSRRKNP